MGGIVSGIFGGDSPKAPDPWETAEAQGQANTEAARLTATLNRANQYTPFGSQTWSQGGTWDEAGYNAAMDAWRTAIGQPQFVANPNPMSQDELMDNLMFGGLQGLSRSDVINNYRNSQTMRPALREPTREEFGYNPDLWSSTISLDPRLQSLLDSNIALQQGLVGAQQGALANVDQMFGQAAPSAASFQAKARRRLGGLVPSDSYAELGALAGDRLQQLLNTNFSYDSLGAMPVADQATRQRIEDALYERITGRLDPMYAQRESDLTSRLAAQGITQGSTAYGDEFGILGRDRNDAYANAALESILMGGDEMARQFGMEMAARQQGMAELDSLRSRAWSEAMGGSQLGLAGSQLGLSALALEQQLAEGGYAMSLQERNQALNELMALMSGTQVQLPQFGSSASGAQVAPAQIGQYMQDVYNSQVGTYNSQQQGVAGLGGALLGAAGLAGGFGSLFAGI